MSVVDLHPEDLLDREARGELSPVEKERLDRHISQCASCRLEHRVRSDFRLEEEPLGPDFDVQRLLSEVLAPGTDREVLRVPAPRRRSRTRPLRPMLLAAAAVLIASAAAAASWNGLRAIRVLAGLSLSAAPASSVDQVPEPKARPRQVVVVGEAAPSSNAGEPPVPVAPQSLTPVLVLPQAAALPPVTSTTIAPSTVNPAGQTRAAPLAAASAVVSSPVSDAAALFSQANVARRTGGTDRAIELYRALIDHHPESREAHESQAVLGRVLLGDGSASAALRCFDGYLRTGGPLEEDVMADRASALSHLGRAHDEVEAWRSLLRAYPRSVHEAHARSRLEELGDP